MRIRFERRDDHSQCSDFWPWHTWPFFTVVPEQLLSFIPGVPLCSFDDPPLLWLKCWEFGIHSSPPFRGRCCQNYCGYLVWVFQARGWWSKKNTACFKESVRLGPGCVFFENQNPGSQVHGYADVATDGASKAASWFFHPDPELCSVLLVSKGIVRMLYHTVFPLKNASFSVTHTHINSMQIYFMYNTHMYFWCQIKVSGVPGSFRDFSELHIFSTEVFSIERWSSKYFQWSSHKIDKNWYSIHYTRLFDLICDEIQVIENGRGISSEDFEKAVENSYDFNFSAPEKPAKSGRFRPCNFQDTSICRFEFLADQWKRRNFIWNKNCVRVVKFSRNVGTFFSSFSETVSLVPSFLGGFMTWFLWLIRFSAFFLQLVYFFSMMGLPFFCFLKSWMETVFRTHSLLPHVYVMKE